MSQDVLQVLKEYRTQLLTAIKSGGPVSTIVAQLASKLSDEIKSGEDWQAFQLAMHTYTQSRKTQDDIGVALDKLEQKWSAIEGKFLPKRSADAGPPLRVLSPRDRVMPTATTTGRVVSDVPEPAAKPLSHEEVFPAGGLPNHELLRQHFQREGRLRREDALQLISMARELFKTEPNLLELDAPLVVCGDIHGQYYDLLRLLEVGGPPSSTRYLFLGDYVDRGYFSCEVCFYMFALKINYPKTFFMLRGNHECRHLTQSFNFLTECEVKYDLGVYDAFMAAFDCLPIAAVMNGQFLCVHGGLSPDIRTLDDIRLLRRFREPPTSGPMCDLLWADPADDSPENPVDFAPNTVRGASYFFGYTASCRFLQENSLVCIIRAHETQQEGYKLHVKRPSTGFPTIITIFSAPNYVDIYNNKAAILKFGVSATSNSVMNIRQFVHSPHPYWLPDFMDVFTWSLPFVAEKVVDMFMAILNSVDGDDEDDESEGDEEEAARAAMRERIRKKIRATARMLGTFKTLRQERENLVTLKKLIASDKLPMGLLAAGGEGIQAALSQFDIAKKTDATQERMPTAPSSRHRTPVSEDEGKGDFLTTREAEIREQVERTRALLAQMPSIVTPSQSTPGK